VSEIVKSKLPHAGVLDDSVEGPQKVPPVQHGSNPGRENHSRFDPSGAGKLLLIGLPGEMRTESRNGDLG